MYDYFEVSPPYNCREHIKSERIVGYEEAEEIIKLIYDFGRKNNKLVVAVSNAHYIEKKHNVYRNILRVCQNFKVDLEDDSLYFRTTKEMFEEFKFLPKDIANEIIVLNPNKISDMVEETLPIPKGTFPPKIDGADEEIRKMTFDKAHSIYGNPLPDIIQERLDKEREERRARIKAEKEAERARIKAEKEAHIAKVKAEKEELFNSLEVGQKRDGKVTKLMPYGAFVDIGGIEGLLHLNNLSWERVESVEDMLSEGQEVQVYVLDIDKDNKKFALALKDINNDPWELVKQEVQLDDIITGQVVRIIEKGAIVKIREGVDAFLPISELSEERVIKVSSVVNIGDIVEAMVIEFKPKNRRMVLSIKEANREPEEDYSEFLKTEDSLGSLGELFKDKFKNLQK